MNKILIFGTGETATLAKFYFDTDSKYKVVGFVESVKLKEVFEGLPVYGLDDVPYMMPIHLALSYSKMNRTREKVYNELKALGYEFVSYISSKATVLTEDIGENAFILENNVIQPMVKIGNNVMLWSGNHVGHGSVIGDHTYFSSHVVLCGNCVVGERNFFGVNAAIKDFTMVGNDCFITMGALVTKDIEDNSVAVGRDILTGEKAEKIKASYFK